MKPTLPAVTVPLTETEKKNLLFLYEKQLRALVKVYLVIIAVAMVLCLLAYGLDIMAGHFQEEVNIEYGSLFWRRMGNFCFLTSAIMITGIYFYIKRALVYKQDAESGVKEKLTYTVCSKEYFPLTNQFYVQFYGAVGEPASVKHETDQESWNNCYEGGHFYIYKARKSKVELRENEPLMSSSRPREIVPLAETERDFLLFIYKKRRRFLVAVYLILIAGAVFICLSAYGMDTLRSMTVPKDGYQYQPTIGMRVGNLAFILCFLIPSGIYFYTRYVLSIKRDADSGVKEKIAYAIVRKEYFPLTDKYFVAFDDPAYLHHETDQETWYNCYEGGYFYIYRAIKSRVVFEENGKFSLI